MIRRRTSLVLAVTLSALATAGTALVLAQSKPAALVYTVRFPDLQSKTFTVELVVPSAGQASVDLMMPVWSPGFYGLQNYGTRVTNATAKGANGAELAITRKPEAPTPGAPDTPNANRSRWTITTAGQPSFTFTYTVSAPRPSNLGNGVTETAAVLIGPASFVTLPESGPRPVDLTLDLPGNWTGSMTSLDAAPDGKPNHYVAPNYDVLADSPILAGSELSDTEFTVGGVRHHWTYLGKAEWAGAKVAAAMTPLVEEHIRFWGGLPYKKYAFLNIIVTGGGSGVEHLNSVAITTSGREPTTQEAIFRNAAFISHEYFHAMNVKRLRPVELGPFDYEHTPRTTGLWVSEGLTSYFGDLLAARSGMGSMEDYLRTTSRHISDLQITQVGRKVRSLEEASAAMFDRIPGNQTVDYYVKGPVVGLVLDAHIRKLTNGRKNMDDVIRLEYKRWSGARGFTAADFSQTMSDAAGIEMGSLLHTLVGTTEEVDYTEMLDWFGLRFKAAAPAEVPPPATAAPPGRGQQTGPAPQWTLEVRPDATAAQKAHLAALLAKSKS